MFTCMGVLYIPHRNQKVSLGAISESKSFPTSGQRQGSADSPYNTEIVLISPNEGKSLSKDF